MGSTGQNSGGSDLNRGRSDGTPRPKQTPVLGESVRLRQEGPPKAESSFKNASSEQATPLSPKDGSVPGAPKPANRPDGDVLAGQPPSKLPPTQVLNRIFGQKEPPAPIDEAKHRHFESFGGHPEGDEESIQMALEMDRYQAQVKLKASVVQPEPTVEELEIQDRQPALNVGNGFNQQSKINHNEPRKVPPNIMAKNQNRSQAKRRGKSSRHRPRTARPGQPINDR